MLKGTVVICALGIPWAILSWLFRGLASSSVAELWLLGLVAFNIGISVSGWRLLRTREDVCVAAGASFVLFGIMAGFLILVSVPVGIFVHEKVVPCLGPLVAFHCTISAWLMAFRVYFSLGVRGLLDR
jgi:hypothetical protein